ncbi:MAG: nuclear transport factor 2 family protein [Actinobacteria bacterium]|nr:MAG: nuclear transport factor 2 family protein [Actinomycetota bacterium]
MPQESVTHEPTATGVLELTRHVYTALNRRDFDAVTAMFAQHAVWDISRWGLGVHVGTEAIRRFMGDWFESLEEYEVQVHELLDLGNGVVYAEVLQVARRAASRDHLRLRSAPVYEWAEGSIARLTLYPNLSEGRGAAERAAARATRTASP